MKKTNFIVLSILFLWTLPVYSEIIFDGSLGKQGSLSGPLFNILPEDGKLRGNNLFHSFTTFDLQKNETAFFKGPNTIENIISRVTGGKASHIDGLIQTEMKKTNVYLMNPSGFIFGPNSKLSIGGSFHVSTSDYLEMGNDHKFYASLDKTSVFSMASPSSFGFLGDNQGSIIMNGKGQINENEWNYEPTGIAVLDKKTISIISSDISFNDSTYITYDDGTSYEPTGTLSAPGGNIHLIAVKSECKVSLMETGVDISSWDNMGDIYIDDHTLINVSSYETSGNVYLRGGAFYISNSIIEARSFNNTSGGWIDIDVETVNMINQTKLLSEIYAPPESLNVNRPF